MSSSCNNIKLDSHNVISKIVCAMCKQCLIFVNHVVCLRNYVNGNNSRGKKQKANVSIKEKQKKHQPKVMKPKKVGFIERLATPKPSKPRFLLRWSPTGRLFDQKGKIVDSSESESKFDCSNDDNACTSNTLEPKIKRFLNSTSLLGRAQIFKKVYVQKDNTRGMSKNTKFAKQSILGKPPMLGEIHALSKPVTSNLVPSPQESKVVKNDKVIAPGMFRINPFKTSREEKHVPNNIRASARATPITVSQPPVFTKKDVNSDSNSLSSTGLDNTKTRRPQPRSNTKNDRVPS
nr:hypothetical protein [Tanacetum cinerariifolium]